MGIELFHMGIYGIIKNTASEILVIKKSRGPYTGLYDLPGGRNDFFTETFEQTLSREIKEETGLTLTDSKQLITLLAFPSQDHRLYRHVGILYLCSVASFDDLLSQGD